MTRAANRDETGPAPAPCEGGKLRVDLGARSYDIVVGTGLLASCGERIAGLLGNARCAIVTDENVARYHLETLESALGDGQRLIGSIVLPAGEATKSFEQLIPLCERLLELGVERGDAVVALGGGVIGDIAGFAASIVRRGVAMVQIPTSLLAQVDSSVGGKTGINSPQGKNLIGTFYQPRLVLADLDVLATLPDREMRAGYAEIAKYGLLGNADFFSWLEQNWGGIFDRDQAVQSAAILESCRAKAEIVADDERESGRRALLNLGHTFGHALEAYCGYSGRLLHGEAISIGMSLAFELSEQLGVCPPGRASRVRGHFGAVGLPTRIEEIPGNDLPTADALVNLMGQDKKVQGGNLIFILVRDIGEAYISAEVPRGLLREFLSERCRA